MKLDLQKTWTQQNSLIAFVLLAFVVLIFFSSILPTYFLADDYNYVGHLLVHGRDYVQGAQLGEWFIAFSAQGLQNPILSVFFRPVVQWLWLTDYMMWGTDAFGYHLTNIFLHILNSFLVYLIALQILRHRWGALAAGLLFALHPIHADSVSWIADRTDVLSTFFYFLSATFFIIYRRRARRKYAAVSLIAFALAIGTKENTVALPLVLVTYDLLFAKPGWRKIILAQIPYALVLAFYVAARFLFLGEFGRNTGGGFLSYGAGLFAQFYVQSLARPFISDIDNTQFLIALIIVVILAAVYRSRPGFRFGVIWILFTLLPSAAAAYVAPRLVYAPSAGLAIALAAILVQPLPQTARWNRWVGAALALFFFVAYAFGLSVRVDDWNAAGTVARAIPEETKKLHPSFSSDSHLYFVGVPDILRGIYIYNDNFDTALRIAYRDTALRVTNGDKFPITADLDRAYFFQYNRRRVTENTDVPRALSERKKCLGVSTPAVVWDFSRDAQGWEAWNDLDPLQVHDGALVTRATGGDPYLASPAMDIPAIAIGEVEIEMMVRGSSPTALGAIYWVASGGDFAPVRQQDFSIQADGAFHAYRVDPAQGEKLYVGDRITRLRLDPGDAPGDIAIKSIRVNVHCAAISGDSCTCP